MTMNVNNNTDVTCTVYITHVTALINVDITECV